VAQIQVQGTRLRRWLRQKDRLRLPDHSGINFIKLYFGRKKFGQILSSDFEQNQADINLSDYYVQQSWLLRYFKSIKVITENWHLSILSFVRKFRPKLFHKIRLQAVSISHLAIMFMIKSHSYSYSFYLVKVSNCELSDSLRIYLRIYVHMYIHSYLAYV
jgi:hypothetical protein